MPIAEHPRDRPVTALWHAAAHGRARKAPATRADAGGDRSNGYWYIRIGGKGYLGHRLAWLYMHGHFPDGLLDRKTETHQAAGSRTCEWQRTAKTLQIQTCVQPLLVVSKASAGIRSTTNIAPESGFEEKSSSWVSTIRQVAARVFGEFARTNKFLRLLC